MSPQTLRAHLARGFLVAVTGSKFLGGPAFSGALLLPDQLADARPRPEPASLGLLLRWEAAVTELAIFQRCDPTAVAGLVRRFGEGVEAATAASPNLEPFTAPAPDRRAPDGWDALATIFSFLPVRSGQALGAGATQALFARLQGARLGQPVAVGARKGRPISVLRLSLSARQIAAGLANPRAADALIGQALATLERTARQVAAGA
jgi:hypothetical protein